MSVEPAAIYSYPRGATSQDLYNSMKLLVDQLRRNGTQELTTQAEIQALGDSLGATISAQIESGLLTPAAAFNLALSAASASIFGAAAASTNAAYAANSEIALDRLTAILQTYAQQAAVKVEQTVRLTETLSLASQITTVNASLATTNASIVTEATARVTGDSANAAAITTVQTQANGNSASITTIQTSSGGTVTNWAVVTNANGQVTGMVALSGAASGTTFTVVADKFVIALPGVPGTTIQAFVAGLVNGVATVGINGNLLVDGTLLARSIAAGTITANEIAAATITAAKLNVTSLSAISANIGTVTAGLIRNAADTIRFDLPNMRLYRTDGKMDIDLANIKIYMETT